MKNLKGTKTEKNLLTAFSGESQARNRYTYYSKKAKEEGFEQISKIFEETANHEKEHAKRLFKFLQGGELEITASFPAGLIGSTLENLLDAAHGENYENTTMYPSFSKIANEEGFNDIAAVFEHIGIAERYHEERYKTLANNIKENTVFSKPSEVVWRCGNCGYNYKGKTALQLCPACAHKQSHFELKDTNW